MIELRKSRKSALHGALSYSDTQTYQRLTRTMTQQSCVIYDLGLSNWYGTHTYSLERAWLI